MAKYKGKKCGCTAKVSSELVKNINNQCIDVCVNPICGSPDTLSIMSPLIYDEIGINLCTTFDLGVVIPTTYPTATCATIRIIDITFTYGDDDVVVAPIQGRPNCYSVTLTNLTVQFAVNLYDSSCRYLATIYPTAVYLPAATTAPTYDEDTNPSSVELEIFAPYGVSYDATTPTAITPIINYLGFAGTNNFVTQGINLYSIPKLINFDTVNSTITVGITLVLQSLYFAGYNVTSQGKINTPKGSILTNEDSACMRFVEGDLLNLAIKPLELGGCAMEELLKNNCNNECACVSDCISIDNSSNVTSTGSCGCNSNQNDTTTFGFTMETNNNNE